MLKPGKRASLKTIVLQSYRSHDIPDWIATCRGTVKEWAQQSGFDHVLADDECSTTRPLGQATLRHADFPGHQSGAPAHAGKLSRPRATRGEILNRHLLAMTL